MTTVAFDTECVGPTDPQWRDALKDMWLPVSERFETPEMFAALSPASCRIVSVGFASVDAAGREVVVYDASLCGHAEALPFQAVECDGEAGLLSEVNKTFAKASRIVSFRGRTYDVPCLFHAMVANGIRPCPVLTSAFFSSRYHQKAHIDLWEAFTCYGAVMVPGGTTLRGWCFRYGLPDPKAHGSGKDVAALVRNREPMKLLPYQMDDVRAVVGLYRAWRLVMDAPVSDRASAR